MSKSKNLLFAFVIFCIHCAGTNHPETAIITEQRVFSGAICSCSDPNSYGQYNCSCAVYRVHPSAIGENQITDVIVNVLDDGQMIIRGVEHFSRIVFGGCPGYDAAFRGHDIENQRHQISDTDRTCEDFFLATSDGRRSRRFPMDFIIDPPESQSEPRNPSKIRIRGGSGAAK